MKPAIERIDVQVEELKQVLAEVRHGLADLSDFSASLRDNFFACNLGF
jgi:hypothetical protein